ncbi:MAG TPA: prolipoprotein diacylglyceryl transferase [Bacteroidia bacterium]|nr:prolipoprotein diacylglyceryl transferase [Bacteroidia bacterium]
MFQLYIYWNPSPEIFTIPIIDWPVRWYGLMWALSFILSHYILSKIYTVEGRKLEDLDRLTLYVMLGTIIGARLGHCLFYDAEYYFTHPIDILKIYEGGLASHGGAIGIIFSIWLYVKKTKENLLWLLDRIVIVVPLAGMLIRIGNLMNSEIIGKPTTLPFGFIFASVDNIPRHPSQLYEAIYVAILFVLFVYLWKNKRNEFAQGFMFGLFCVLLFTFRFFIEFLKENQESFENQLPLNMGQILSIPFIIVGIYFILKSKNKTQFKTERRISK